MSLTSDVSYLLNYPGYRPLDFWNDSTKLWMKSKLCLSMTLLQHVHATKLCYIMSDGMGCFYDALNSGFVNVTVKV